jgi:hypothetical protein
VADALTGNAGLVGLRGVTNRRTMTRGSGGLVVDLFEQHAKLSGFVRSIFKITTATASASMAASDTSRLIFTVGRAPLELNHRYRKPRKLPIKE